MQVTFSHFVHPMKKRFDEYVRVLKSNQPTWNVEAKYEHLDHIIIYITKENKEDLVACVRMNDVPIKSPDSLVIIETAEELNRHQHSDITFSWCALAVRPKEYDAQPLPLSP